VLRESLPRDDVKQTPRLMYTMFNEAFHKFGMDFPPSQEDFDFAKKFTAITENLLAEGKLETHPDRVGKGGLQGALEGMEEMKAGKVSGEKLVYKVDETP